MTAEQWKHLEPCGALAFALCYASQSKMIPQIQKKKKPRASFVLCRARREAGKWAELISLMFVE